MFRYPGALSLLGGSEELSKWVKSKDITVCLLRLVRAISCQYTYEVSPTLQV